MSFTFNDIYPVLKKHFPQRNDFYPCSYKEEFEECQHFGISNADELDEIVSKYAKAVLDEDFVTLDENTEQFYYDELGKDTVEQRVREGYWFSYPALLRMVLEKAFGEKYHEYVCQRDHLDFYDVEIE